MVIELAQERSLLVAECELGGVADGSFVGGGVNFTHKLAQLFENVVVRLDQLGSVADQSMAAATGQAVDGAGYREDLAVLLHRGELTPIAFLHRAPEIATTLRNLGFCGSAKRPLNGIANSCFACSFFLLFVGITLTPSRFQVWPVLQSI